MKRKRSGREQESVNVNISNAVWSLGIFNSLVAYMFHVIGSDACP